MSTNSPRRTSARVMRALVLAALGPAALAAQERQGGHGAHADHHPPADSGRVVLMNGLGRMHRPIATTVPLAQRFFDQGLALAYAFNHAEAKRSFAEAARLDPSCAMCHWGVAYVLGPNINAPMDPAANAEAHAAATRAADVATAPLERALAGALLRRYAAPGSDIPRTALDSAYAVAMAAVARTAPDDPDVAALHAEALMNLSPWSYWTRDRAPRPGTEPMLAALERALRADANHPGACHFYIHAVEAAFPERAVACAERLAALMPAAGHLVHMPAHIYLRVGRWDDAIRANEHAVHADETLFADRGANGLYAAAYYPHNHHFLAFAATMAGREARALEAARAGARHTPAGVAAGVLELQLVVAAPYLTLATFGRWEQLLREPMPQPGQRLATALAWQARGRAASALGRPAEARAALDSVAAIEAATTTYPAAPVLRIARLVLGAEIAERQGDRTGAVARLTEAVSVEDAMSYMEPPYWFQPVRPLLGATLLRAGRATDAERAFREDLARFPKNVWSERGLARSVAAAGGARAGERGEVAVRP